MRKNTILILVMAFVAIIAHAQITLDSANFPVPAPGTEKLWLASSVGLKIPSTGAAQTWDLTNLKDSINSQGQYLRSSTKYYSIPVNPAFPSSRYFAGVTYVGQLGIVDEGFEDGTAKGYAITGFAFPVREDISLAAVTFGSTDSVIFPVQNYKFLRYLVKFPSTYKSSWNTAVHPVTNFLLDVGALNLKNAPGTYTQYLNVNDSVVGYGAMRVHYDSTSQKSEWDSVLMVQETYKEIDSIFIERQGLTDTVLSALGITNGASTATYSYIFYRRNTPTPFAVINTNASWNKATSGFWDANNTSPATGIEAISSDKSEISVYPNPVTSSNLSFNFVKQDNGPLLLNIANSLGQVVQSTLVNQPKGNVQMHVSLPAGIANGLYYYNITEKTGNAVMNGKFILNR